MHTMVAQSSISQLKFLSSLLYVLVYDEMYFVVYVSFFMYDLFLDIN